VQPPRPAPQEQVRPGGQPRTGAGVSWAVRQLVRGRGLQALEHESRVPTVSEIARGAAGLPAEHHPVAWLPGVGFRECAEGHRVVLRDIGPATNHSHPEV
jgi:hypothetical protein